MMDGSELKRNLNNFIGTTRYHRWSVLYPYALLTDGTLYLAEKAEAFWLMDLIASWQYKADVRKHPFQVWTITRVGEGALVVCTDGNNNKIAHQKIEYTEFPFDTFDIWLEYAQGIGVILLPSEH